VARGLDNPSSLGPAKQDSWWFEDMTFFLLPKS